MLGVDTPLFLCNTLFCFSLSSLLVRKSHRSRSVCVVSDSSDGTVLAYNAGGWGSIPSELISFNRHVYNGFGGRKISFVSNYFH
jgi:hypothetical protein